MNQDTAFDRIYRHVPTESREWLRHFPAAHPHAHHRVDGAIWDCIVAGLGEGRTARLLPCPAGPGPRWRPGQHMEE